MTLPRELRDKIYRYLLRVDKLDTWKHDNYVNSELHLSILRVSQRLHIEAF